jgi:hypothetical protein
MILPLLLAASLSAPPAISILVRAPDGTLTEPTAPLKGGNFSGPGAPPYEERLRRIMCSTVAVSRGDGVSASAVLFGSVSHPGSEGRRRSFHAPPQHPRGSGFGTSRTPSHAGAGHRGGGRATR